MGEKLQRYVWGRRFLEARLAAVSPIPLVFLAFESIIERVLEPGFHARIENYSEGNRARWVLW